MQDRTRVPLENLHAAVDRIEVALRQAAYGMSEWERTRPLQLFSAAKGGVIAALDAIEEALGQHAQGRVIALRNGGGACAALNASSQQPPPESAA